MIGIKPNENILQNLHEKNNFINFMMPYRSYVHIFIGRQ